MGTLHRLITPLFVLTSLAASGAAMAAPNCNDRPPMGPTERRIAGWASQGVIPLRQMVASRKGVYQYNIADAMETGMRNHEWLKACGRQVADAGDTTGAEPTARP
jgi:hypothetical protein